MMNHFNSPSLTLVIWTIAAVSLAVLVLGLIVRLALHRPVSALYRGALFTCVVTIVWVYPGLACAAVLVIGRLLRIGQSRIA